VLIGVDFLFVYVIFVSPYLLFDL